MVPSGAAMGCALADFVIPTAMPAISPCAVPLGMAIATMLVIPVAASVGCAPPHDAPLPTSVTWKRRRPISRAVTRRRQRTE